MGVHFNAFVESSYPKQMPTVEKLVEKVGLVSTFLLQLFSQRPKGQLSHLNLKESSIAEKLRCVSLSNGRNHFLNANRRKGLSQRSFFFPFTLSSHRLIHT